MLESIGGPRQNKRQTNIKQKNVFQSVNLKAA